MINVTRKINKKGHSLDVESKEREAELNERIKETKAEENDGESDVDGDNERLCEVESVLKMKTMKNERVPCFLVKWKGYDKSQNSWEPKSSLMGEACEYHKKFPLNSP